MAEVHIFYSFLRRGATLVHMRRHKVDPGHDELAAHLKVEDLRWRVSPEQGDLADVT